MKLRVATVMHLNPLSTGPFVEVWSVLWTWPGSHFPLSLCSGDWFGVGGDRW